jgi:amino acid transporter
MENYVAKIGPGMFLLLLFVTPWLWGVPTALATAELSARYPVSGGYYKWAQTYLSDFWAYQQGMWNLLSSLLDNALYPVLFARAIEHFVPEVLGPRFMPPPAYLPLCRWLVAVLFIALLTYLNYRGIQIAGGAAVALNVFLIAPLFWLVGAAILHHRYDPFTPFIRPGVDPIAGVGTCLALAIWLYSGYTEVSVAAEEIENPRRNIPLALVLLTPIVILSYAMPTIAGLMSVGGWQTWDSGEFQTIGTRLGGEGLGRWLFLGSAASQAVIFLSYLLWWSRLVWAMAKDGHLPGFLSKLHPRYGTPHRILLIYGVLYAFMAAVDFDKLLVADAWLAGAAALVLEASLVFARRRFGPPDEGFKVPGGEWVVWACFLVPAVTWLALLVLTARENYLLGAGAILLGPALFLAERLFRGGAKS